MRNNEDNYTTNNKKNNYNNKCQITRIIKHKTSTSTSCVALDVYILAVIAIAAIVL